MTDQVYRDMIDVMNQRGMLFGALDIPEFYEVVEELFTPEEAAINNAMPLTPFTAKELAEKMGRDETAMAATLKSMADKGLCVSYTDNEIRMFRAVPFVPGIFEFIFYRGSETERDKRLAELIYRYKEIWQEKNPITLPYPMQRVITVDETVESGNKVHTYDQVKTYIEENDNIAVGKCYCRQGAKLRGEDTHGMPMDACMFFGQIADFGSNCLGARKVSREEALKILDECEEAGLIHQTSNVSHGVNYLCNCDRWHCFSVKIALEHESPAKIFNSGFEPRFDPDLCTACETCIERCPAEALQLADNDVPEVDLNRCFGCAVCATGCPSEAIKMFAKPDSKEPPKDQKALMEAMMASFAAQG